MNAKDRVMKKRDIKNYVFGDKVWELLKEQLEAQDDISFKAGQDDKAAQLLDGIPAAIAQARKNGIREVVEFVETHQMHFNRHNREWCSKKKEWLK